MPNFPATLPQRTPRVEALMKSVESADLSGSYRMCINMFESPAYANASFMKRRAMYVEKMLSSIELRFFSDELVVGSIMGVFPRMIAETYEERKVYARLSLAFPARNTVYGTNDYTRDNRCLSDEELHNTERGRWSWGHSCFGLQKILTKGYLSIAQDAEKQIADMQASGQIDLQKIEFWESVSACCHAVINYAERHAVALEAMAADAPNSMRRDELLRLAARIRRVPAFPASSFAEAVQSTWFSFMCHIMFSGTDLGRLDQYLYPYYAADIEKGILTAEQAQELLDCMWVKFTEWRRWHPHDRGSHPSIMLAGVNADGQDGTNAVTYLCLNATRHVGAPTPKLSVRVNEQTPSELYELAHDMLTSGLMMPDFYNERAIINAYAQYGIPFQDAVCFSQSVCEEISLAGISEECTNEGPHIDLHDLVMLSLRKLAGQNVSFDQILSQVDAEIAEKVRTEVDFHNEQTALLCHYLPQPLHSATIEGCVESGKDIYAGGTKYNNTGSAISGIATASNSLYTIKRLVYDEKRLTIPQMLDILDHDYQGNELLRTEILSKFPKYGNDDQDVDQYAVRMFETFSDELGKYRNSRGGVFKVGAWASEFRSNYPATPDGRKRFDSFAVNVSPTPGTDQQGATSVIRTTTKLGLNRCTAGGMTDVTLSPSCIKGENGADILRSLVQTYCQLDGCGLQFNLVDSAMLENAQKYPHKYKNLMVRVWGYNDYFVSLPDDMKRHIVDRTKHEEAL